MSENRLGPFPAGDLYAAATFIASRVGDLPGVLRVQVVQCRDDAALLLLRCGDRAAERRACEDVRDFFRRSPWWAMEGWLPETGENAFQVTPRRASGGAA